jgi:hypothetical protein
MGSRAPNSASRQRFVSTTTVGSRVTSGRHEVVTGYEGAQGELVPALALSRDGHASDGIAAPVGPCTGPVRSAPRWPTGRGTGPQPLRLPGGTGRIVGARAGGRRVRELDLHEVVASDHEVLRAPPPRSHPGLAPDPGHRRVMVTTVATPMTMPRMVMAERNLFARSCSRAMRPPPGWRARGWRAAGPSGERASCYSALSATTGSSLAAREAG